MNENETLEMKTSVLFEVRRGALIHTYKKLGGYDVRNVKLMLN